MVRRIPRLWVHPWLRRRRYLLESLESRCLLAAAEWTFEESNQNLPPGWYSPDKDEAIEECDPVPEGIFPWRVNSGVLTGESSSSFSSQCSWVETPTFQFLDGEFPMIEYDVTYKALFDPNSVNADQILVRLVEVDTGFFSTTVFDLSAESLLMPFDIELTEEPQTVEIELDEVDPGVNYRVRFLARDYDEEPSIGRIGFDNLTLSPTVIINPPTVSRVAVGSSSWSTEFRTQALSGDDGFFPIPTDGDQLRPIPWSIDEIRVRFSEDVNVARGDLIVTGTNSPSISALSLSNYDATTFEATWSIAPVTVDSIWLNVADAITSKNSGLALDGEYTTGAGQTSSGNGTPGGEFRFRVNVLSGDTNQNGVVGVSDVLPLRNGLGLGASSGSPAYSIFADLDGSGVISVSDVLPLRNNLGKSLPHTEPAPPVAAAAAELNVPEAFHTSADAIDLAMHDDESLDAASAWDSLDLAGLETGTAAPAGLQSKSAFVA